MLQNSDYMLSLYPRKPLQKLIDRCTVSEIFKKSGQRDARAAKHPLAAYFFRMPLD